MRTNQTIRRIFSILITLGMLLTFLPFSKQAIADGDLSVWYIFDTTPEVEDDANFTIHDTADDPGDGSSWVGMYIDGTGTSTVFDATGLDPRTELILNNAQVENASIYQDFRLLGTSRIDYEGRAAYTSSESDVYFKGFDASQPETTMQNFLQFINDHYYQDIGPTIATHITGYQELNEPCDYSYLVIDEKATLAITPAEGSNFDHIPLHIWNDLTVYGNLYLIPSWTTEVGIEFMDGATFIVNEGAAFQFGDGVFLDLHNRIENDFINLDPGRYVFDGNIDEWVNQQGQRNDGIYIGSEPEDLFTGISFTAMQNGNEEPLKSGSDEGGFISKSDYEEADYIEIKIFTSQPLFLEIYDGSDPEHREPLDPSLYDLNGSVLTIYKGEGEGADWFSVYDIWLKTEGIYFNYDREEEPIKNLVYTAGSNSGNVDNYYIAKSIYEDADSITFAFDISDPERDITLDVHDENDNRIDEQYYEYADGEITLYKPATGWGASYNIFIGVDHSQDPREDGIHIGWDESTMVRKAVYEVKSGDNVLSSGDVDQEFIPRDQYDLDSADSIVITFDSDKSLVIEVFDDADPRHRLNQSCYAINENKLTIFKSRGEGNEAEWFSSYEIWVKAQGIYLNYDHQEPPVGSVTYTTDNNYGTVTNYYIAPNVYENEDSITLRFEILDQERGLTIDVRDENDDRIDEQSGVYEYADGALTIYKTGTEWGPSYNIFIGVDHSNDPREKGLYIHLDDRDPVVSDVEYIIYYVDGSSSDELVLPENGFIDRASLEGAESIGIKCNPMEGAENALLSYNYMDVNGDLIDQILNRAGRYVYFGLDLDDERSDYLDIFVSQYLGDGINIQYDLGEVDITFEINSNGNIRGLMGNNISIEDLRSARSVTLYFTPREGFSVIEATNVTEGWSEGVVEGESLSYITIEKPYSGWRTMNISVTTMPVGQEFPDEAAGFAVTRIGPGDVSVDSGERILARKSTGTVRKYYYSLDDLDDIYLEITPNSEDNAYIKRVAIYGKAIKVENPDQPFRLKLSDYIVAPKAGDMTAVEVEFGNIAVLEGFKVRLDDSIGVDYYIQIPDEILYKDPSVTFTLDSLVSTYNTQEVPYSEAKYVREGSEYYFVYSCEVTAADMTQPISATFKAGDLEVTLPTFTVRDYAKALIKGDDKTSDLARKLLNYGYYAQNKFAKGTQMFEEDKLDLPSDSDISGTPSAISTPDGVTYQGSTVVFLSGSRIRHYFQLEDGRTAVFEVDGQTRVPVTSGSMFYVTSDVINILDASIPKSVKISCDGGDPVESSYSVMDYIYAVIRNKNQNMSQEMIDLAKAFYIYHEAAANY